MTNSRRLLIGAAAVTALVLSACGDDDATADDDDATADVGDADLTVVALDSNDFDQDAYTVGAGDVTIAYEHGGSIYHTLVFEEIPDFMLEVNRSGEVDEATLDLEPGEYEIYCDVPGHRQSGMEATLTVE